MQKFHKFVQVYLAGAKTWNVKLFGKESTFIMPLILPWILIGMILLCLYQPQVKNIPGLCATGVLFIAIGLFGFFYYDIFSNQNKTKE